MHAAYKKMVSALIVFLLGFSGLQAKEAFTIQNGTGRDMAVTRYGDGKTAVILAHQYDASGKQWVFFARELESKGFAAYTFDFNGHGKNTSGGKRRLQNHLDLVEMVNLARAQGAKRIYLVGSSMGAAAVLKAGVDLKVDGIIAMAPYLANQGFASPSQAESKKVLENVLLFTAKADSSHSHAVELDNLLPNSVLYDYPGDAHGMGLLRTSRGKEVREIIFGFLQSPGS